MDFGCTGYYFLGLDLEYLLRVNRIEVHIKSKMAHNSLADK
jgi:abortive infection bacteriophage resistance protein